MTEALTKQYGDGENGFIGTYALIPQDDPLSSVLAALAQSEVRYDVTVARTLRCLYRDLKTGKEYETPISCNVTSDAEYDEQKGGVHNFCTLLPYIYHSHQCPCHRQEDIRKNGGVIDKPDKKCKRGRYLIVRVWHPSQPDRVLYWEKVAA